jgi:hypothetical protein
MDTLLQCFKQVGEHFNMITNAHDSTNIKWGHSCQIKISMYSFLDFNISKMELAKGRINLMGGHDF